MTGREIRQALRDGKVVYSTCLTTASPQLPMLLRQAHVDFAFIDAEHTPRDRESLSLLCHQFSAAGIPPVVRIPSPDPVEAAKVIDGGAAGIIGPYMETPEQVRSLVGATRWRPLKGKRLEKVLADPGGIEPELREYLEQRNQDLLLILNIESVPAIEKLGAMLEVLGVDAVLIGPHDLSCSLGIPERYNHPRFEEAVQTIIRQARSRNIGAGVHFWDDIEREIAWAKAGANLVMHSADIRFIRQGLTREIGQLRSAIGGDAAQKVNNDFKRQQT
jgi:2-keto-3-deoxy-L-rhamnonate aldolase RhmA